MKIDVVYPRMVVNSVLEKNVILKLSRGLLNGIPLWLKHLISYLSLFVLKVFVVFIIVYSVNMN